MFKAVHEKRNDFDEMVGWFTKRLMLQKLFSHQKRPFN